MENNTAGNGLMRRRGAASCIRTGYGLYADNFNTTLKSSWIPALVYSLICAAIGALCVIYIPDMAGTMLRGAAYGTEPTHLPGTLLAALIVIGGLVEIVFYSCGMSLLRSHKDDGGFDKTRRLLYFDLHTAVRTLKITLTTILVCALAATVLWVAYIYLLNSMGLKTVELWKSFVIMAAFAVAMNILILPFIFSFMRYILNDNVKLIDALTSGYAVGLRRLHFILAVAFITMCVAVTASAVIQLPAIILTTANAQSVYGTIYGDPSGMPGYMPALTAATFFFSGFIQTYIRMSVLFPLYYAYGSTETVLKEKAESNKQQNTTER